jgi:intein-encoded DNA endonuclease-like protein
MPREVLQANPDVPQIVVDYRKLVAEPKQTVEQIYGALGIEMSDAYRQEMDSRGQRAKKHKTKHSYSAEEFGMDIERMQSELADFFEEYRWLDEMEIK